MTDRLAYGIHEAATALGISDRGIWRLVKAGDLATIKIGARALIPAPLLQALVERLQGTPPSHP